MILRVSSHRRLTVRLVGAAAIFCCALIAALAEARSDDDFFRGKTMTISTFTPPGGSYDTYARLLARYIATYIPGHPTVVVVNQPGAGGLLALNYAARLAPRDGTFLTLAGVGVLLQGELGGAGMYVSLRDLQWIGNFSKVDNVLATLPDSTATKIEDAIARDIVLGSVGAGSIDAQLPAAFNSLLGTRLKVITGYPGNAQVLLALDRGEIEGTVSSWTSLKAAMSKERSAKLHVLLQMGPTPAPDLPTVPVLGDLVKADESKLAIADFLASTLTVSRPVAAPPEVPPERVNILRRAFDSTLKDASFLDDLTRTGFDIDPMTGEEVEGAIERILSTPKDIMASSKAAIEAPTR